MGHSAFEQRGLPKGVIRGAFVPTRDYEAVRQLFRADHVVRVRPSDPEGETVLRAYYKTRDQLRFAVIDPEGALVPVEYLHVYEPSAPDVPYEVVARLAVRVSRDRKRSRWFTSRPDA